jgi:hypothetical protein
VYWTIVLSNLLVRNWLNIVIGLSGEVFAGRLIIEGHGSTCSGWKLRILPGSSGGRLSPAF